MTELLESAVNVSQESSAAQNQASASLRFSDETGFNGPVTSLYGTVCRAQPKDGELPVLKSGVVSMGCDYQAASPETSKFYDSARDEVAQFFMRPGEWLSRYPIGSGVIVGPKDDANCLVLTDNHVSTETEDDLQVRLADGIYHDGTVVATDPTHDLALVSLFTGDNTAKVCRAAKFDESSNGVDRAVGFPAHTTTPYLSEGKDLGTIKRSDYRDGDGDVLNPLYGEDTNRPVILMDMHVEGANSGSPVYGPNGVRGLVDAGDNSKLNSSFATPVSPEMVDALKRSAGAK